MPRRPTTLPPADAALVTEFQAHLARGRRGRTAQDYSNWVRRLVAVAGPAPTPGAVSRWLAALSASSRSVARAALGAFDAFLRARGGAGFTTALGRADNPARRSVPRPLSPAQVTALRAGVAKLAPAERHALTLALEAGLHPRVELLGVRHCDVLRDAAGRTERLRTRTVRDRIRVVPLTEPARRAVDALVALKPKARASERLVQVTYPTLRRALLRVLPGTHLLQLRHAHVAARLARGESIENMRDALGHGRIETTSRYLGLDLRRHGEPGRR